MISITKSVLVAMQRDNLECFEEEMHSHFEENLRFRRSPMLKSHPMLEFNPPVIATAAYFGANRIVDYLLACGNQADVRDDYQCHFVHFACAGGNITILQRSIEIGLSFDVTDKRDRTPCHYAASYNRADAIKWLWAYGANLNMVQRHGWNCIHCAAWSGSLDVIRVVISLGISPSQATIYSETPLQLASFMGHKEIVKLLLDSGAELGVKDPVYWAAKGGHADIVMMFAEYGADLNAIGTRGESAAIIAAERGFVDVLDVLLQMGADMSIVVDQMTPYSTAKQRMQNDAVKFFEQHGITE